jgi:tRNA pseudouridine32 synthase/23S rRNA pseudouridine746 synthase
MGFLLSGLIDLEILYQDEDMIAVHKPAGLLSVPGRTSDRADSVITRLRYQTAIASLIPVHRLDQETSGILLCATHPGSHRHLQNQFQTRQVQKIYEAVLDGHVTENQGRIDLPLWGDPRDRPKQTVDVHRGKSSITDFQVLDRTDHHTRVEFVPVTGRTHQLRVHAADPQGLGTPILGDRLYGDPASTVRLHLHARAITVVHPRTGARVRLCVPTPF